MAQVGVYGMGTMGLNVALNFCEKGFVVSISNRSADRLADAVTRFEAEGFSGRFSSHSTPQEFVASLAKPRVVIMMVNAGAPVDGLISTLSPLLEAGDILIDGGNEFFTETDRRSKAAASHGLLYLGMGISGGEEGARYGPSLMPGGNKEAYDHIAPMLRAIAARAEDGTPCVAYIGPGGSGNYVKMVHNGIEYADMQLIAEARRHLVDSGLSEQEILDAFVKYRTGPLRSYLIDITCDILRVRAGQSEHQQLGYMDKDRGLLVDFVSDVTGMKGTGTWTVQQGAAQGVAIPSIAAALASRQISGTPKLREKLSEALSSISDELRENLVQLSVEEKQQLIQQTEDALLVAKITAYAQGFALLRDASKERGWDLQLAEIARLWRAGCIIRAGLLDKIASAMERKEFMESSKETPELQNLLLAPEFTAVIKEKLPSLRVVVLRALARGEPAMALAASLTFLDGLRNKRLPTNLTQAQRDYFGAHTFTRTDLGGIYHERWSDLARIAEKATSASQNLSHL